MASDRIDSVNRRQVLKAAGISSSSMLFVGCLSGESLSTAKSEQIELRRVSLAEYQSNLKDEFGIVSETSITNPTIDPETTAGLRLSVKNEKNFTRTLSFRAPECGVNLISGSYVSAEETDGAQLWFVPKEYQVNRADGCWYPKADDEGIPFSCGSRNSLLTLQLDPGETHRWEFEIWQQYKSGLYHECMPTGRYRFRREFASNQTGDDLETPPLEGTKGSIEMDIKLDDVSTATGNVPE